MKKQSSSDILLNEKCDKRKEIESIIGKLKYSELSINEIPFEYQQNMDIIREERKLNLEDLVDAGLMLSDKCSLSKNGKIQATMEMNFSRWKIVWFIWRIL